MEISNVKLLASEYDSDRKIINHKNYVKKLRKKLEALGFKFKDKNKKGNNLYIKANAIV